MATTIYEELGILSLTTILLFFWIGQHRTFIANLAVGLAFAAGSYVVLLAYPALAFFATPVIFFYCGAFLLTAANARELWWKLGVGGVLLATMLAAHIPLFFKNLYSYTYGAYFSDRIVNSASRLTILKRRHGARRILARSQSASALPCFLCQRSFLYRPRQSVDQTLCYCHAGRRGRRIRDRRHHGASPLSGIVLLLGSIASADLGVLFHAAAVICGRDRSHAI